MQNRQSIATSHQDFTSLLSPLFHKDFAIDLHISCDLDRSSL
ncbi:hypothetical protein V2H45_00775 [Tumidithrix elongata RA019]|uniref:Uncharacterized protein n=1 Tax=Tumidithrix elongata BACA0141 TaxID=2716417 RepID=A0AAW9PQ19_9CYAN|nr:hypothetical protein [Tumidithrix elongata RA019]